MSVRVIRSDGSPAPLARTPGFVRVLDGARYEARVEAERMVAAARAEADAIVARAREEATAIAEQARESGRARAEAEATAILLKARADAHALAERTTDLVIAAARATAERALGQALATDDAALAGWAREAVATLAGARRVILLGNERTLARLSPHVRDLGPAVELRVDDLPDFTVRAVSELGDARVALSTQVDVLVQALSDVLAAEVRRRV